MSMGLMSDQRLMKPARRDDWSIFVYNEPMIGPTSYCSNVWYFMSFNCEIEARYCLDAHLANAVARFGDDSDLLNLVCLK